MEARASMSPTASLRRSQSLGTNNTYTRVWREARRRALSEAQERSPLARVPYHLRHAAVSLWLNAGVPATQVAEWAGHSVHVLMRVYAKCVYGQDEAAQRRIEAALTAEPVTADAPTREAGSEAGTPTRMRHDQSGGADLDGTE
jgi:integrase